MIGAMPRWHLKVFPLILASLLLAVDQISKFWIRDSLMIGESVPEEGLIRLTRVANQGIIFGLDVPLAVPLLLSLMAIAISVLIFYRYGLHRSALVRLAMGFFVGGTLGNTIDRLYHGQVTDFIDISLWGGLARSVSNPADVCALIGISLFLVAIVRLRFSRVPSQAYLVPYLWRRMTQSDQDSGADWER
jgi:signal peptidase II